MPFESVPIPRPKAESFVEKAAIERGVVLSEEEKLLVNQILDTMPEKMNSTSMTKWCKNKVDKILIDYPELTSKADLIRNYVRNEFMYFFYEDKFDQVKEFIAKDNPEVINPQWLRNKNHAISLLFRRSFRTMDDKVDWDFIIDKLGIKKDRFSIEEHQDWDEQAALSKLTSILENNNPENFNPEWILEKDPKLHSYIVRNYKTNDSIDWSLFISKLGPVWQNQWLLREVKKDRTLNSSMTELTDLLEKQQPEVVNPYWIFKNLSGVHNFVKEKLRTADDQIHWQLIVDLLPIEWQQRWKYQAKREWNFPKLIVELEDLLERENPETFNSSWIDDNDKGIYLFILRNIKNGEGEIDWEKIIASLPEKWQQRWRIRMRDEIRKKFSESKMKWTFDEAADELNRMLNENDPAVVSGTYIGQKNPSLLSYFVRHVKDSKGNVDWERIISQVDSKFHNRFRKTKRLEDVVPAESYDDPAELQRFMNDHHDKLYTILEQLVPEDKKHRDQILKGMVDLAKKGNLSAKEKVLDYLEIVASDWVEKNPKMAIYKYHMDTLRRRLERCIFYFGNEGEFIAYIYASLHMEGKGLARVTEIEFDTTSSRDYKEVENDDQENLE